MVASVEDAVFWSWGDTPAASPLDSDLDVDAVVVGGGLAGLFAAATFADRGLSVALLERDRCGAGATGRSSGFLTPDSEMQLTDLRQRFGDERARVLWDTATLGIASIRARVADGNLDCDLHAEDSLFVARNAREERRVVAEHESRLALGYESELLRGGAVRERLGGDFVAGVRYGGTGAVDGWRLARALRGDLIGRGVHLHEGSCVDEVAQGVARVGVHRVRARHVVLCTDRFSPGLGALPSSVGHIQTFIAVSEPLDDAVLARIFPAGPHLVWEARLLYHYARVARGGRLLVGGSSLTRSYAGAPHHDADGTARTLERWVERRLPGVVVRWAFAWPGLLGVTRDFLPLAGEVPEIPGVHTVAAATGLPWCAAMASAVAGGLVDGVDRVPPELSTRRSFRLDRVTGVLGKTATFAAAHAIEKLT